MKAYSYVIWGRGPQQFQFGMKEGTAEGVLWHSCSHRCAMKIRMLIFLAACSGPQTAVLPVGTHGPRESPSEACLARGEAVCTRTIPQRGHGAGDTREGRHQRS